MPANQTSHAIASGGVALAAVQLVNYYLHLWTSIPIMPPEIMGDWQQIILMATAYFAMKDPKIKALVESPSIEQPTPTPEKPA